jgi:hypothetical protein
VRKRAFSLACLASRRTSAIKKSKTSKASSNAIISKVLANASKVAMRRSSGIRAIIAAGVLAA